MRDARPQPGGPLDSPIVSRFGTLPTFARLPQLREVPRCDVAVVGIPFDSGVTFRSGARFVPAALRQASRCVDVNLFGVQQLADAGDVPCTRRDDSELGFQIIDGMIVGSLGPAAVALSPPYDHAEITAVAGAHVMYELLAAVAHSDH